MKRLAVFLLFLFSIRLVQADSTVVFSEIMYHPQTNEAALEWVELHNQMTVDMDISGWSLEEGIQFKFPEGTIVPGRGYLVVAISPATLMVGTVLTNVLGPFTGRLSNSGEVLELRNNNGRTMDSLHYGVDGDWPVGPDGAGLSLARRDPNSAVNPADNWSASVQVGGTPGSPNFPPAPPLIVESRLLEIGSAWKYNDAGAALGETWRSAAFDDTAWPEGNGLFHDGEGVLPAPKNTPLAPGRSAYYFRMKFLFDGDLSRTALALRSIIDDGAVVYLNGGELLRMNMPAGTISYATPASVSLGSASLTEPIRVPVDLLLIGLNTLAVEVHQANKEPAYSQAVLKSDPVAYWRLSETTSPVLDLASATSAPQQAGQNGTLSGFDPGDLGVAGPGPSDSVGGQLLLGFNAENRAPRFQGNAGGGNDVIIVPDEGALNFVGGLKFSIEAWVNGPASQESGGAIVTKGLGGGGEQYAIDVANGFYRFFLWTGGSPNAAVAATANIGPKGTWQHLAAVFDRAQGWMKLFVNGQQVASASPPATIVNSSQPVSIGARRNANSSNYDLNFNGRIDEVAIYNRALSEVEVRDHYNAAFDGSVTPGLDTRDVAFGMELSATQTLPAPPLASLFFNEIVSSTDAQFWLEIINPGRESVPLGGYVLARLGGTYREYVFPPQTLGSGESLVVPKALMGFGADAGDKLVLYSPERSRVMDAVVARRTPQARHPDGEGPWLFPDKATPGAANSVQLHDEIVINEIMYHPLPFLATPTVFSGTNQLITATNLWRYNQEGEDLEAGWRAPDYNDAQWLSGPALLYSSSAALPFPKNTGLSLTNEAGRRIVTYYFRAEFQFEGDLNAVELNLRPVIDDGAVFYLNGVEVYRFNMPIGPISHTNFALAAIGTATNGGPWTIASRSLVAGRNILAVEVHQANTNLSGSDVVFGAELTAALVAVPAVPFRDATEAWLELYNRGSISVDLTGWRLAGGIGYGFAVGQKLAPGAYLVVANQPEQMRALHPGIEIVGPFTNALSRNGERIALEDANNNPADAVRYFDGGRWPEYADGGGSSLELRDPRSDNSQGGAWAASDEASKSPWRTYRYRGVARNGIPGAPTQWREFALGLLDGPGEILLDDISVVETPDTSPVQLIQNGTFDGGAASHWRLLGNHQRSGVVADPDQPGNFVLRVLASGATEYMGNQIETTLANNRSVVDGRIYEISYRVKWLGGSRQLNTRLYFNRLPATTPLAVPESGGTPGARNSRYSPNLGPTFGGLQHQPAVPEPGQPVVISVRASDPDEVATCLVNWRVGSGNWNELPMALQPNGNYAATLPGSPAGTLVQFYVSALDALNAASFYPAAGPDSRALYKVNDGQVVNSKLRNFRILMRPAEVSLLHAPTNVLSNERLRATVIYGEEETFYDVGVRLKGSFVGRDNARVGFNVQFNPDQRFRGVHDKVSVDRSSIQEIVLKHVANHAGGIPSMYDDLINVYAPRPEETSVAQLRMAAFEDIYLDSQFQNGSDGTEYEFEVIRYASSTVDGKQESAKNPGGPGYVNIDIQNMGPDKENYRWLFLITNQRTRDDYSRLMPLAQAFSLSGGQLDEATRQVMDVDEWMRTFALQSLGGVIDVYSRDNHHNLRLYVRPEDGRVLAMPWDWDNAYNNPGASLYGDASNLAKIINLFPNRRLFYHHLQEMMESTFNSAYLLRWTQHYAALSGQSFSEVQSYVGARTSSVKNQLPARIPFSITSNNGRDVLTDQTSLALRGNAWIDIEEIRWAGSATPLVVSWVSQTIWQVTLPLILGTNIFTFAAYDYQGQLVGTDSIGVTSSAIGGGLDSDGDGLPDSWEVLHGLDPAVKDSQQDLDKDGLSNWEEYLSGTDPARKESALELGARAGEDGTVRLTWEAVAGRSYSLLAGEAAEAGAGWQVWTNMAVRLTNEVIEVAVPAERARSFYRLVTPGSQ